MARLTLFLFVVVLMISISWAGQFQKGFWPDFPSETFKWEEVDANDPEQINDEKDVDQYGQNEMDGKGDAKLANIHGKGSELYKREVCPARKKICRRRCYSLCKMRRYRGRRYGGQRRIGTKRLLPLPCRYFCTDNYDCRWECV